jgi:hypothetical protein
MPKEKLRRGVPLFLFARIEGAAKKKAPTNSQKKKLRRGVPLFLFARIEGAAKKKAPTKMPKKSYGAGCRFSFSRV